MTEATDKGKGKVDACPDDEEMAARTAQTKNKIRSYNK